MQSQLAHLSDAYHYFETAFGVRALGDDVPVQEVAGLRGRVPGVSYYMITLRDMADDILICLSP